ncbi:MAG: 50S ribosome-binding GTPase [Phycisphaerae bacterium]|nr:50S ribosome-binding GTPase [Phycisphaerae bacterium]
MRLSGRGLRAALSGVLAPIETPSRGRGGEAGGGGLAEGGARAWAARVRVPAAEGAARRGCFEVPALVVWHEGPRSYTGEDCAEVLLAGNPHLIERVVGMMASLPGVREARPGEFSARAFMNGRLTLAQAEGVAAAIGAGTREELAAAREAMAGTRGAVYAGWAGEAGTLLALVEAGIDFSDQEDVVAIAPGVLAARVGSLVEAMARELGSARGSESAEWAPVAVLAGPPNAGKSTLFNALLGRRRAITSSEAGTTRDALVERLGARKGDAGLGGWSGLEVMLVDLPGLDEGGRGAEDEAAQARAREAAREADVVVRCLPSGWRGGAREGFAVREGARVVEVETKADLSAGEEPGPEGWEWRGAIRVCAVDGRGIDEVRGAIIAAAWQGDGQEGAEWDAEDRSSRGVLLPRHRRAVVRAMACLREAGTAVDPSARALDRPEEVAARLRAALDWLGELTGRMSPDAIIGRVFATFCVGK